MPKKIDSLNTELYGLLKSHGFKPKSFDSSGESLPVPDKAEAIQFPFVQNGVDYGKVTISIDGQGQMTVYFDEDAFSEKSEDGGESSWFDLLRQLKQWAMKRRLTWSIDPVDNLESDMAKRAYIKKEGLNESYHSMGKKQSYNDVIPETKIIIKHSRNIEEGEQRFRNVERIFIENALGERILAPTTKPGIAQVYARHIAEGGLPHDERWNHIKGLCEEYNKMAGFVRATRGGQFNESTQKLVTEGVNHYLHLRECLGKMRGKKGYNSYFESWTPPLMEDEVTEDLSDMFKSSSLDPRIESVLPILGKLNKNLSETKLAEVAELEEWANNLGALDEQSNDTLPSEKEADYGPEYQDMVSRVGKKAKAQEKKKPVDIQDLARRLNAVKLKHDKIKEGEVGAAVGGVIGRAAGAELGPVGSVVGSVVGSEIGDEITGESLDSDQRRAGQMGPTDKVSTGNILGHKPQSQKGLRGKLVSESLDRMKKLSGL